MLIPLGFLAGSGGEAGSFELIETQILGSSQANVTFSNLDNFSSSYRHLQLRMTARDDRANNVSVLFMRINGDTGTSYASHELGGTGSSVFSFTNGANQTSITLGNMVGSTGTTNSFGAFVTDILDAYSTTKNKTVRTLSGVTGNNNIIELASGSRFNTASITSLTIFGLGSNLTTGSRFSLYGIRG